MNTASRCESTGKPGAIHISRDLYELLQEYKAVPMEPGWRPTGGLEAKGKGVMETWILEVPV